MFSCNLPAHINMFHIKSLQNKQSRKYEMYIEKHCCITSEQ